MPLACLVWFSGGTQTQQVTAKQEVKENLQRRKSGMIQETENLNTAGDGAADKGGMAGDGGEEWGAPRPLGA